ncbi:MAG: branched-chain amino acid ABC transporter permease, partial [Firmicutes bacterium]|nr:branched-chain amino acid ABC transporter permease [Bacillota bacterium]
MLSVGISVLLMALLGQSWNIMSGYAGQFSFGHAAFFGLGAYTSSILYMDHGVSPWIGMIAGMVVAALVGVLIGFLSFRYKLRGD